jgi:hypothetical protein
MKIHNSTDDIIPYRTCHGKGHELRSCQYTFYSQDNVRRGLLLGLWSW